MAVPTKLGLFGAEGHMGRCIIQLLEQRPEIQLLTAVDRSSTAELNFRECDVVIDFSIAGATTDLLHRMKGSKAALVSGVTGRSLEEEAALDIRALQAPVFCAANFSLGIALLKRLAQRTARALGEEFQVEIMEIHHQRKVDAPSGTALLLGQAIAEARGLSWPQARAQSRTEKTGPRSSRELGFASLRGGEVVGEHTLYFLGEAERLELRHQAQDRRLFALGALRALHWVQKVPAGRYGMDDMLSDIGA